jgi:hypothetical protein
LFQFGGRGTDAAHQKAQQCPTPREDELSNLHGREPVVVDPQERRVFGARCSEFHESTGIQRQKAEDPIHAGRL